MTTGTQLGADDTKLCYAFTLMMVPALQVSMVQLLGSTDFYHSSLLFDLIYFLKVMNSLIYFLKVMNSLKYNT